MKYTESEAMEQSVNDIKLLEIQNAEQIQEIALIGQALSSPTRVEILRLLNVKPYLMSEISAALNIQPSSAAFHLKMLENAGLLSVEYSTKSKGSMKWFSYGVRDVLLRLRPLEGIRDTLTPYTTSIHIGDYVDAQFNDISGQASDLKLLVVNEPRNAFHGERHQAQYIWNRHDGYVTYAIANEFTQLAPLAEISLSLEICSETNGYNNDYPSDITFWINGVELCTWTCPGDFGDKYGTFTPAWWFPESTKYGLLTKITVTDKGVFLNDKPINKHVALSDLHLSEGNRFTFQIGVKKDAKHCGGFNLFGEKFGNFNQAISFTATYKKS